MNLTLQNVVPLLLIALAIWWFMRGRRGGGGHGHGSGPGHHHGGGPAGGSHHGGAVQEDRAATAVDPVSGATIDTVGAITAAHDGRIYYFASRENRDRFEAAPEEYARRVADSDTAQRGRHGGC